LPSGAQALVGLYDQFNFFDRIGGIELLIERF
jgi:hypothetical protein